jgi:hypothetical protein
MRFNTNAVPLTSLSHSPPASTSMQPSPQQTDSELKKFSQKNFSFLLYAIALKNMGKPREKSGSS